MTNINRCDISEISKYQIHEKMSYLIKLIIFSLPRFYRNYWNIALLPFFVSLVTAIYSHNVWHLLIGLALSLPIAVIGTFLFINDGNNW